MEDGHITKLMHGVVVLVDAQNQVWGGGTSLTEVGPYQSCTHTPVKFSPKLSLSKL